jgi:DNA-binding CsgD family transcriptional regulator
MNRDATPWGDELPLVGRRDDLSALKRLLQRASEGEGHCVLLTGEAGVGKSRLLAALVQEAESRNMIIAAGSAFAMETGVPYGAFADALAKPLRALDTGTLTLLTRGAEDDLRAVVPGLAGEPRTAAHDTENDNGNKSRLLWNVTQFLTRLAARTPMLVVLDNAHDSDASSLELLHFLARQIGSARMLVVIAYVDDGREANPVLRNMVRSLLASHEAKLHRVESLTSADLAELLKRSFTLADDAAESHANSLWSHTRGNPFFVEESLKALATAGRIRKNGAQWTVEGTTPAALPPTVRDAVLVRLESLEPNALRVAEIASVVEDRASLALLELVSALDAEAFADAIDTLCSRRILVEYRDAEDASYEFGHPIIQSTVRSTLTAAREKALHVSIAKTLETIHGSKSIEHAVAIARHIVRGQNTNDDARALHYLAAAGRDALVRRADAEAVRWLHDALVRAERLGDAHATASLLEELATALLRTGAGRDAVTHWQRAEALAYTRGDQLARTRVLHLLAQEAARSGDARRGLVLLDSAETAARAVSRDDLVIRIHVARAKMQQSLGAHSDATRTVAAALAAATVSGNVALLARVHQTALQLYAWTGPASVAREHGARALELAAESGDREVAWASHWAMAMLEGFTGDVPGIERHLEAATALAESLASPVLQAMTAEIAIEHASGIGKWDEALAAAEKIIPLVRAVAPQSLLPRLLVWTGLIVLARDDSEKAHTMFDEAWQLSGAERMHNAVTDSAPDIGNVHNVILAHTGMGTYYLTHGDWARAVEYGEKGLALADRFGYVAWAIHRLIPLLIEAQLRTLDYDRVEALTIRLRKQSTDIGHKLGLAWATASEALVARVKYQQPDAAAKLIAAADELDAVPFVFHAARMRRNAAQVLEADGDTEAAIHELRHAHDVFVKLGAEFELRGVRSQLRSLGARVPSKSSAQGAESLTGRELEIARAVARRLSNKEIGTALDISARTVSTHLSNIFEKLGVDSRGTLADYVREHPVLGER